MLSAVALSLSTNMGHWAAAFAVAFGAWDNRQIFFCSLGGFDTHSQQVETLLQQLRQAVNAFYTAISQELNVANNVAILPRPNSAAR